MHNRRLVIRADDAGFSLVDNIGCFRAVEEGVVTSVDVMLDCPGTEDALLRLRKLPYVAVGWHAHHMWGTPVLDSVPSMTEQDGPFKGRFRMDLTSAADVDEGEVYAELRAELERCRALLGRLPDLCGRVDGDSPFSRVKRHVLEEYGIPYNIYAMEAAGQPDLVLPAAPRWAGCGMLMTDLTAQYRDLITDSQTALEENYDPLRFYQEDRGHILTRPVETVCVNPWHPGYIDEFVYRFGERANRSRARHFTLSRVQDVIALTSPVLRDWIEEHRIELVSFTDVLRGEANYQQHLKSIGSPLCVL